MKKNSKIKVFWNDILEVIDILDDDFDICFTSPPYNLSKNHFESEKWNTIGKIQKYGEQKDYIKNYVSFLETVILKLLKKCKYFFLNVQSLGPNKKDLIELQYRLKDYYCDTIIWNKGNGIPNGCNKRVMTAVFEYIHIYSLKPNRCVGTKEWRGNVCNVINLSGNYKNKYSHIHKALFPLELANKIVSNFVKPNGKVLDCFGGLGTTMIACILNKMDGVSVEINETYAKTSVERINEYLENKIEVERYETRFNL